jgi:hypothetical protein
MAFFDLIVNDVEPCAATVCAAFGLTCKSEPLLEVAEIDTLVSEV